MHGIKNRSKAEEDIADLTLDDIDVELEISQMPVSHDVCVNSLPDRRVMLEANAGCVRSEWGRQGTRRSAMHSTSTAYNGQEIDCDYQRNVSREYAITTNTLQVLCAFSVQAQQQSLGRSACMVL